MFKLEQEPKEYQLSVRLNNMTKKYSQDEIALALLAAGSWDKTLDRQIKQVLRYFKYSDVINFVSDVWKPSFMMRIGDSSHD